MTDEQEVNVIKAELEFEVPVGVGTIEEMKEWLRFTLCQSGSIKSANWFVQNQGTDNIDLVSVTVRKW